MTNSLWIFFCFADFENLFNDEYKRLNSIARVAVKVTDDYTWNSLKKCSVNAVGFCLMHAS